MQTPVALSYVISFNILLIDPISEELKIQKENLLIDLSDLNKLQYMDILNNITKIDYLNNKTLDFQVKYLGASI